MPDRNVTVSTLESGIVVPMGIVVLVGTFARFDKRTGGNKRTGGHIHHQRGHS